MSVRFSGFLSQTYPGILEFGALLNFRPARIVDGLAKQRRDVESIVNEIGIRELHHRRVSKALGHVQAHRFDPLRFGNARKRFDRRVFVAAELHFQDRLAPTSQTTVANLRPR